MGVAISTYFVVKILNWPASMHEQQDSVSGGVSHCLCRLPCDNTTTLKFIRVFNMSVMSRILREAEWPSG